MFDGRQTFSPLRYVAAQHQALFSTRRHPPVIGFGGVHHGARPAMGFGVHDPGARPLSGHRLPLRRAQLMIPRELNPEHVMLAGAALTWRGTGTIHDWLREELIAASGELIGVWCAAGLIPPHRSSGEAP